MRVGLPCSLFAMLAAFAVAPSALAQPADGVRSRGIRLGNFELHPGIGAALGYDSNVFLQEDPQSSGVLRVGPYIYISSLGEKRLQSDTPPKLKFRAGANGSLKHYFAFTDQTNFGIGQDAKLTLQPSQVFAIDFFDEFNRTIDPFSDASISSTGDSVSSVRDQLGVGTRLQLSTPGGLLTGGLGYRFDIDLFEDPAFEGNGSSAHTITGDTSWEFLPKTDIFWNGSFKLHGYHDQPAELAGIAGTPERNDSVSVDSKFGINGALTATIGFTVAAGYGAGFFEDNNDFESVIVEVEGRFQLMPSMIWTLGYDREFQPAFQGNFTRVDRGKTRLQALVGERWAFAAKAEFSLLTYGHDDRVAGEDRIDRYLVTGLSGEFKLIEWLALSGELGYSQNFTDYEFVLDVPAPGTDIRDAAKYNRVEAWLGLRAFL